jgi:hypothetical protein
MVLRASRQDPNRYPPPVMPVERCDRSQSEEAAWLCTSPSGAILTLCGHHRYQHEVALHVYGWTMTPIKRS